MSESLNPRGSFGPPFALRNRHVQSTVTRLPWIRQRARHDAATLLAAARSEVLDCGDGVRLQGFYAAPDGVSRGLVILLHGWEGCADSDYILSASSRLFQAGFEIFRLNLRDHGDTHALNQELFHSCRIDEVVGAVKCVMQRHAARTVALVGQSLGGNFAVRVAVRAPAAGIDLRRVLAICPVLKPHSTMQALEEGLWIYRRYFLQRWRRSLLAKAAAFPDHYQFGDLRQFGTLTATTDFFVRNYTEFANLDDYLEGYALTGPVLERLAVPTRFIMAADDPVVPYADLKSIRSTDALAVDLVTNGGHCGFVESFRLRRWIDAEIVADLGQHL